MRMMLVKTKLLKKLSLAQIGQSQRHNPRWRLLWVAIAGIVLLTGCPVEEREVKAVSQVDHSTYDEILKACVGRDGLVDYGLLEQKYTEELTTYLDDLSRIDVNALERRGQRLAFWINAYNALCLKQIVDLDPEMRNNLSGSLFFDQQNYYIAGRKRSLNEIQHDIIRRQFKDPRAFAAMCPASQHVPPWRAEAYQGDVLNYQLDHQCRLWIAMKELNRLDMNTNCLYLSGIFRDYMKDFNALYDTPKGFFLKYTTDIKAKKYLKNHTVAIKYLPRNGTLNSNS